MVNTINTWRVFNNAKTGAQFPQKISHLNEKKLEKTDPKRERLGQSL